MGVPPPGKGRPNHPRSQQEHLRARSSLACVQVVRKLSVSGNLLRTMLGVCRSGLSDHVAQWCIPLLGGDWHWSCFSGPFGIDLGGRSSRKKVDPPHLGSQQPALPPNRISNPGRFLFCLQLFRLGETNGSDNDIECFLPLPQTGPFPKKKLLKARFDSCLETCFPT